MKDVDVNDVLQSMLASETDYEAAQILERYCAHVVKKEKHKWVSEVRQERKKRLEESSFTRVIKRIEGYPDHGKITEAIKMLAEAFREREDHFYRRRPG